MRIFKYTLGLVISVLMSSSYALESLDDSQLTEMTGQAGADLAIKMSLNHTDAAVFDTTLCSDMRYCRLGLSLNNRYHDGSQDTIDGNGVITPSATGKKQWLVFKGIQGTINIQEMKIDGETVTWGSVIQPAVKLGFTATKPIEIRNLGFQSLSIETDTVAAEATGNIPGYLTPATLYGGTGFDATREKGFVGLNINTNLAVAGTIKMFACGANHPRC